MRVADISVLDHADACVLRARVETEAECAPYNGQPIVPFDLWFRFPSWCGDFLRPDNGDPFLATLLVPAMTLGERLDIPAPVSPTLLRSLPQIQSILHCFDPRQSQIEVTAPAREQPPPDADSARNTGLFFSLGIDSFYSLLKNERDHPRDDETVSHLITLHGMDVWGGVWDERFPAALLANSQRVARETGKTLLPVTSNMRAALDPLAMWTMTHGAGLASIPLALGGFFGAVRIAATTTYDQLYPWGSHPLLDPLWSTEAVRFLHDGCELDRIGKTALVAQSPLALDTLRVCAGFTDDYNCGRCVKCLPTMIDLLQLGALARCQTLPHAIDAEHLRLMLNAYRGGLHIENYQRRRDGFIDEAHADLKRTLAEFLADHPPDDRDAAGPPSPLTTTAARSRLRRLGRWLRQRRGEPK